MAVHERTERCAAFYNCESRRLLRTLRGGTEAMRLAGTKYLPMEPAEEQISYKRRLARSKLSNFTKRAIKNLSSKPFTRPIAISSDRFQDVADVYVNAIDRRGTSLTALASTVFEDALWQGTSFIAVDASAVGGSPYAYHLSADNLLGFRLDEDDNITYLRIKETGIVEDGDFGEKSVGRVRIFKRFGDVVTWDLWEEGSTGYQKVLADQAFGLSEIPVLPIHSSPVAGGELLADAPLTDLAYLNLAHFQEDSDCSNILHIASIPILFGAGMAHDAVIKIGSETAIRGDVGATLQFVEITGASIAAGRQSLIDLESRMSAYGAEMLQNFGAIETATGRALRAGENNNQIAMIASQMASGLEKVMGWISGFNRLTEPDFKVDIDLEYGINVSPQDLAALQQARTMGDLSREDYLAELKRRGILRNDFSQADNEDRIATELV